VATSAAFVGLVLGAAWLAWRMVEHWTSQRWVIAAITAVITFVALGVNPGQVEDPTLVAFFLAGVVSLVALILPGFPGSTALITIGMYQPIVDAVADREFAPLVAFGLGGVLCLAALSTALDRLLHSRHDAVVAALIGLMVGSVRSLWPWQDDAGAMLAPVDWAGPLLLAVAGFVVVAGVGWWAGRRATGFRPPASGQQDSDTNTRSGG
jgi:putative membrane protein